jgi:hypothetical protein
VKDAKAIAIATAIVYPTSSQNPVVDNIVCGELAKAILLEVEAQAKVAIEQLKTASRRHSWLQRDPLKTKCERYSYPDRKGKS